MIVKMKKVFLVARAPQREALLEKLRELGVVHLAPVERAASAPEELERRLTNVRRAQQVIDGVGPSGEPPELDAQAAVEEILAIARRAQENRNRLVVLGREVGRLGIWGELRRQQLDALAEAGVPVAFYSVGQNQLEQVSAECVAALAELPRRRVLVAVVQREGQPDLPEDAQPVETPARDLPSVRAEAKQLDAALAKDAGRLARLAGLADAIEQQRRSLAEEVEFARALAGAMAGEDLFAVQGWAPRESAETLDAELAARGLEAAVETGEPTPAEEPPTLIRYPRWARPIKGLFDILGTFPGYREFDVSGFFMIALPIFAAMLIGDAGYGLLFLGLPLLLYRKLVPKAGKAKLHLLMTFGAATLIWGVLTANYFGLTPETMARAGGYTKQVNDKLVADVEAMSRGSGFYAVVGNAMSTAGVIWMPEPEEPRPDAAGTEAPKPWNLRDVIIAVSFIVGAAHLIAAHLRRALQLAPDQRWLAEVGWCLVLVGMLGVIWMLFFKMQNKDRLTMLLPLNAILILLVVGSALAVFFGHPDRNPFKRIGIGFAASLLPLLGTFSDTMSYIRLMAVGLASYYIAAAFNGLGATLADAITWFAVLPLLVILFGHLLNIGLAMIAIFAHGVRLNMLEFSNNANVQWSGYSYQPFAKSQLKET